MHFALVGAGSQRDNHAVTQDPGSARTPDSAVTVVVAGYEHRRYVQAALDAVAAQTLRPAQVIITDDGSSDDTREAVRAWLSTTPLRSVAEPMLSPTNRGLIPTLNDAVARVRGDYLAMVSMDDLWGPEFLSERVAALRANPRAAIAYSDAELIDEDGRPLGKAYRDRVGFDGRWFGSAVEAQLVLAEKNVVCPATTVVRTSAFRAVGMRYSPRLSFEDWDLWVRLAMAGYDFAFVSSDQVQYRVSQTQLSHQLHQQPEHVLTTVRVLGRFRNAESVVRDRARATSFAYVDGLRQHMGDQAARALLLDGLTWRRLSTMQQALDLWRVRDGALQVPANKALRVVGLGWKHASRLPLRRSRT